MLRPIRRALMSVSDKTGLVDFARELVTKYAVELIATGGTHKALADAGLPVKEISTLTGFPEILDGRVKSLHPAIFAGLLARRDKPEHLQTLAEHHLPEIDLVVCNLYPFEQTVAKPQVTETQAIENIDIGGPCMVRAAAKNFDAVAVATDPTTYPGILKEMAHTGGQLSRESRRELASGAFSLIARYDHAIANYFLTGGPPGEVNFEDPVALPLLFVPIQKLRYGENPHQPAAFFSDFPGDRPCIANAKQLHGKELSYNNILDLDSALNLAREFAEPTAVVVKHNNPCGAATGATLVDAFRAAWDGDPQSAFGGILAFNRPVDADTAAALMDPKARRFIECVIAPDYEPNALDALCKWKENVRLLKTGPLGGFPQGLDYRRVDGGLLVQARDIGADHPEKWKVVTKREPTAEEFAALHFAWLVCKHVKSNAIVLAQPTPQNHAANQTANQTAKQAANQSPDRQGGGGANQTANQSPNRQGGGGANQTANQSPNRQGGGGANQTTNQSPDRQGGVNQTANQTVSLAGATVVGVGAGQMSRVDSVQIAVKKAGDRVAGSVLASDAFFPFRDNVDAAAAAGVVAIIQPGGSVKDPDSIAACNEHGLAMVFTGTRHFRH